MSACVQSGNKSLSLFSELRWGLYLLERNSGSEVLASTLRKLFAVERDNSADLSALGKQALRHGQHFRVRVVYLWLPLGIYGKSLLRTANYNKETKCCCSEPRGDGKMRKYMIWWWFCWSLWKQRVPMLNKLHSTSAKKKKNNKP